MNEDIPPVSFHGRLNVVHMLRSTHQHHVQLSIMADQKANILMGAAFLVLTVAISRMQSAGVSAGLLVLSIFTLAAAACALMAVMPSIPKKKHIQPNTPHYNPLFFSFYSRQSFEEYYEHMETLIKKDETIFKTILNDIYQLGQVLQHKKYRYLGYSYRIFLIGMLLSVLLIIGELSLGYL
ncbi:MAG: hypothetical protein HQK83_01775 [Fibrobacteria bacterium]|nr:hypothetical protein [Fibrobacteria bacterium]